MSDVSNCWWISGSSPSTKALCYFAPVGSSTLEELSCLRASFFFFNFEFPLKLLDFIAQCLWQREEKLKVVICNDKMLLSGSGMERGKWHGEGERREVLLNLIRLASLQCSPHPLSVVRAPSSLLSSASLQCNPPSLLWYTIITFVIKKAPASTSSPDRLGQMWLISNPPSAVFTEQEKSGKSLPKYLYLSSSVHCQCTLLQKIENSSFDFTSIYLRSFIVSNSQKWK